MALYYIKTCSVATTTPPPPPPPPPATVWSEIPPDVLLLIASGLADYRDLLTFRSVCSSWRSAAIADSPRLTPLPPSLILPYNAADPSRNFFNAADSRRDFETRPSTTFQLPHTVGKFIYASAHGWLILADIDEDNNGALSLSLYNPITDSVIYVPSLIQLDRNRHPHQPLLLHSFQIFLSGGPRGDPPPILALWADNMLFSIRIGDCNWSVLRLESDYCSEGGVFAYCHGCFFLSRQGRREIKVVDAHSMEVLPELDVPSVPLVPRGFDDDELAGSYHMVVSLGDLFLVVANYPKPYGCYKRFVAFRLVKEEEEDRGQRRWRWFEEAYNNKGGNSGAAFFLSDDLSVGVASPSVVRCKPNYMYEAFPHIHTIYPDDPPIRDPMVFTAESGLPFITYPPHCEFQDQFWIGDVQVFEENMTGYTWFVPNPY